MNPQTPVWFIELYSQGVTHHYQSMGFTLKNTTLPPVRIEGKKMYFMIAGVGDAEEDVKRGDVAVPMNAGREKVEVTTTKDRAFDEIYEDDLTQMTVNERQVYEKTASGALGRTHDRKIIKALKAGATKEVGAYADPLKLEYLLQARQMLNTDDVPTEDGELFFACDSVSFEVLMTYKQISNSEYTGPALPYTKAGNAVTWRGIHIFQVSDSILRTGDNANEATCLLWHKSAIGFGTTQDVTTTPQWDNRKDCWTMNMRMRNGCKVLLPKGVVKVKAKFTTASITLAAA